MIKILRIAKFLEYKVFFYLIHTIPHFVYPRRHELVDSIFKIVALYFWSVYNGKDYKYDLNIKTNFPMKYVHGPQKYG